MRWFRNLSQTFRRLWKERRAAVLTAAAALAVLALLAAQNLKIVRYDDHPAAQEHSHAAPAGKDASRLPAQTDAEQSGHAPKQTEPQTRAEIAAKWEKWQAEHKWLVVEKWRTRYVGPQTADALLETRGYELLKEFHGWSDEEIAADKAKMKAFYERVLQRGAVFHDTDDIGGYGESLMMDIEDERIHDQRIKEWNKENPDEEPRTTPRALYGLPESASWEELENAIIDHELKIRPIRKAQTDWRLKTGEGTINVELSSEPRAIGYGSSDPNFNGLTDEEIDNISRYGIAPKGYRLRFVKSIWDLEELPPDKIPFFSEKPYVEKLSDARLQEILTGIPSYLSQPEAQEESNVMWMSMVDRYEAALTELAARGQVPQPFAGRGSPSSPSGYVHPAVPPGAAPAPGPPVEQRESAEPPVEARDEAALAEAERRRRIAEAFVEALEKAAEKGNVDPAARSLIAARLRELRIMKNPDLLKPPVPPSSPPPSSEEESEEDDAP